MTNANRNGFSLTAVTLNDGNEYQTHEELYEYAFSEYKTYKILDTKKFKSDDAYYPDKIYIRENFSYPLTEEEKEQVKVEVKLTKLNDYRDGDVVGLVTVRLNGEEIHHQKVYVQVKSEKKGLFSWIRSWFS